MSPLKSWFFFVLFAMVLYAAGCDDGQAVTYVKVNPPPGAYSQKDYTPYQQPLNITLSGTSTVGGTLVYSLLSIPEHGTITGTVPTVPVNPTDAPSALVYTPFAGYSGPDSFTFRVNDGQDSNTATVDIVVGEPPSLPVAFDQERYTPFEQPLNITLSGTSTVGGTLVYSLLSIPEHGTITGTVPTVPVNPTDAPSALVYTPFAGYSGPDSFTFRVNDGQDSNTATVDIVVGEPPSPPVAYDQIVVVAYQTPELIVLAGETTSGTISFAVVDEPVSGTLSGTAPNFVYTPNAGFSGPDSFTFMVNDGQEDSDTATVLIWVEPPVVIPLPTVTVVNQSSVNIVLVTVNGLEKGVNREISEPNPEVWEYKNSFIISLDPGAGYVVSQTFTNGLDYLFTIIDDPNVSGMVDMNGGAQP